MKTEIKKGGMTKAIATQFSVQIKRIYPDMKLRIVRSWKTGGYEMCQACHDGSYEKRMAYAATCEDYIEIHSK